MKLLMPTIVGGTLVGLAAYKQWSTSKLNGEPEQQIPFNISIVMPTLNEERYIQTALESLKTQSLLNCECREKSNRKDEIIVADSKSTDRTVDIAKLYGCRVIECPKGKLSARNHATKQANGDIIVSVDADTYYPPNWLYLICRNFNKHGVNTVSGNTFYEDGTPMLFKTLRGFGNVVNGTILKWLPGQNSAFLKSHFIETGGFYTDNVNENSVTSVWFEEEFNFLNRMSTLGKFVHDHQAVCITSGRRITCEDLSYCTETSGVLGMKHGVKMGVRM